MRWPFKLGSCLLSLCFWSATSLGAEKHWAFELPRRYAGSVESASAAEKLSHPVDFWVAKGLKTHGLGLSAEAHRSTLLRRLWIDLIGLTPPQREVESFSRDTRLDAYDRQVDRLLASPHFGERWGRHWLDLARYSDSNGYSIDGPRTIWAYRDWVVRAFNEDMPFDQFVIGQMAGDLLNPNSPSQQVATGFHRNTMINEEGGIDKEQFRIESIFDRVNTTGAVFLGLTVGCAQCHDHKYDPISQKDYYRLFACFNSDDEPNYEFGKTSDGKALRTMVLAERSELRPTHVYTKGDFTRPRELVTPGVPQLFGGQDLPAKASRLHLARWLVSNSNPLTARVTVNRIWMRLFGIGLVETENDFGTQGTLPTHPELLDSLSNEFVNLGWSHKKLIRHLVTSRTYRQTSLFNNAIVEKDPLNKWLGRQNRLRIDAEVIRDLSLWVSGLLDPRMGGPSVFPPAPEGATSLGQVKRTWKASLGGDRYRRGLYTYAWRATPFPAFTVFDAPDGTSTCTRRLRSNTPLQALTLLNDSAYVEAAESLAFRMKSHKGGDREKLRFGFLAAVGRPPSTEEFEVLEALLGSIQPMSGETENSSRSDLAWLSVARTLLNLDEFITRE